MHYFTRSTMSCDILCGIAVRHVQRARYTSQQTIVSVKLCHATLSCQLGWNVHAPKIKSKRRFYYFVVTIKGRFFVVGNVML